MKGSVTWSVSVGREQDVNRDGGCAGTMGLVCMRWRLWEPSILADVRLFSRGADRDAAAFWVPRTLITELKHFRSGIWRSRDHKSLK